VCTRETLRFSKEYDYQVPRKDEIVQMTERESDYCIVPMKGMKVCGGKAVTQYRPNQRNISRTGGGQKMETELIRIAKIVSEKPEYKLQTIIHVINVENLKEIHKKSEGRKAAGVDNTTKAEYNENLGENLEKLIQRMKRQGYKPQPSKRVFIPKDGSNGLRPLGIPAYEDKLVQEAMRQVLNTIYEPLFLDCSYGFRQGRSQHDAIKDLDNKIAHKKTNYVVEVDIKAFFDNVDHEWMMKFIQERIEDPNFLRLIKRFLKAGIMEEGKYFDTDKGAAQGGLISPILSNIYLHYVLDLWFEKVVKRDSIGEAHMVRYADDFVCTFQSKDDAEKFLKNLKERLNKFSLEIAVEKTKMLEFGRFAEENRNKRDDDKPDKFDFLGFTHICGKTREGKFTVKRITSKKKMKVKRAVLTEWLRKNMHKPVGQTIEKLNTKLVGHFRYYGITGNSKQINKFRYEAVKRLFWTLNRRNQMRSYSWEDFKSRILAKMPIKPARIYVNMYS
jgi:group II intron reverse transcriptase/maturase